MRPRPEAETATTKAGNGAAEARFQWTEDRFREPEDEGISRVEAWVRERVGWEDWGTLLPEAVQFAAIEVGFRFWRGAWGGVLPEGYDANSIAAEVIQGMLTGKCRLALGWTRERFVKELQRRIRNEVRRLASLIEASKMRNEWDLLPLDEEDEPQSIFDGMPGSTADPREVAEQNEEDAWREKVRADLNEHLRDDKEAQGVFNCLCEGVVKRRKIAERLGMSVEAVTAARKRLERKVEDYKYEGFLTEASGKGAQAAKAA